MAAGKKRHTTKELIMSHTSALKIDNGAESTIPAISDSQAKEYDYILVLDKSGSMGEASTTLEGRTRWDEAQEFTESFARFAEKHDDDGITVITFSSSTKIYDGVKADKVHEIFVSCQPGGSTNLAAALDEAFKKKFSSTKAAIIVVMTDGQPDSETSVKNSIITASNKIDKDGDIGIQFVQIGNDPKAAKFLSDLDDNLKGAKFDIVNSLTREEAEKLTIEQILYLAIND